MSKSLPAIKLFPKSNLSKNFIHKNNKSIISSSILQNNIKFKSCLNTNREIEYLFLINDIFTKPITHREIISIIKPSTSKLNPKKEFFKLVLKNKIKKGIPFVPFLGLLENKSKQTNIRILIENTMEIKKIKEMTKSIKRIRDSYISKRKEIQRQEELILYNDKQYYLDKKEHYLNKDREYENYLKTIDELKNKRKQIERQIGESSELFDNINGEIRILNLKMEEYKEYQIDQNEVNEIISKTLNLKQDGFRLLKSQNKYVTEYNTSDITNKVLQQKDLLIQQKKHFNNLKMNFKQNEIEINNILLQLNQIKNNDIDNLIQKKKILIDEFKESYQIDYFGFNKLFNFKDMLSKIEILLIKAPEFIKKSSLHTIRLFFENNMKRKKELLGIQKLILEENVSLQTMNNKIKYTKKKAQRPVILKMIKPQNLYIKNNQSSLMISSSKLEFFD